VLPPNPAAKSRKVAGKRLLREPSEDQRFRQTKMNGADE